MPLIHTYTQSPSGKNRTLAGSRHLRKSLPKRELTTKLAKSRLHVNEYMTINMDFTELVQESYETNK